MVRIPVDLIRHFSHVRPKTDARDRPLSTPNGLLMIPEAAIPHNAREPLIN